MVLPRTLPLLSRSMMVCAESVAPNRQSRTQSKERHTILYIYIEFFSKISHAHDVCEHAGSRDGSACAVALYEERVLVVTLGGEQENVVRAFEVVERMSLPVFAQS